MVTGQFESDKANGVKEEMEKKEGEKKEGEKKEGEKKEEEVLEVEEVRVEQSIAESDSVLLAEAGLNHQEKSPLNDEPKRENDVCVRCLLSLLSSDFILSLCFLSLIFSLHYPPIN